MLGQGAPDLDDDARQRILRTVTDQVGYLNKWMDEVDAADGAFSEAWRARGAMYGDGIGQSYWAGATQEDDLPAMPGDGSTQCLSRCGCGWEQRADGWYWVRGKADSCPDCVQREQEWAPYQ